MIYLDYCAHTPVSKEALDAFCEAELTHIGNVNSEHSEGVRSMNRMMEITDEIAGLCKVTRDEIIYTSGATEANNLAIKGVAEASKHVGKHIISTSLEHTSASASLTALQAQGYEIDLCPMGRNGMIDLEELEDLIRDDTCLVAVSAVDSELGVKQRLKEIEAIVREYPGCRMHIDATQAIGKIPFDFSIGDTIAFAPHKFYGINGVGVLIKRTDVHMTPQISGGKSTTLYRSGTPTLGLAASIVPSLATALEKTEERYAYVAKLNAELRAYLESCKGVLINSPATAIPHILNLSVTGVKGVEMQKKLDEKGICVSVKSACSSDLLPSKAVMALTRDKKRSYESFRISLSHLTTEEELNVFKEAFSAILENR